MTEGLNIAMGPARLEGDTVQSLDRGLMVLDLLTGGPVGAAELARILAVDRASVYRILRTLVGRGLAEKATDGRFRASLRHLLGMIGELANVGDTNWLVLAQSHLKELTQDLGLASNLCMPAGTEMVYLLQELSSPGLTVNCPPGTRRPVYSCAVGKAYLGALPPDEADELLEGLAFRPFTPRTRRSPDHLRRDLVGGRRSGYFTDDRETDPFVRCFASPVLDRFGRPIASIGVSGPTSAAAFVHPKVVGERVRSAANSLSMNLGYTESWTTPNGLSKVASSRVALRGVGKRTKRTAGADN